MHLIKKNTLSVIAFLFFFIYTRAQDSLHGAENLSLHFQATYIYQHKPSFHSPYQGTNSLNGLREHQNSITSTLYFGARLWKGAQFYLNPEIAGGSGLSGAEGMAGSSNGETFRVGDPAPTLYWARYYLVQTFALGNESEWQDADLNKLAGNVPKKAIDLFLGKLSLGDLFDNNEYSNSPRTQFLNWSLMNNGAWDYAANVRGYTYTIASELSLGKLSSRIALAALPKEANGAKMNFNFKDSFALAINAEIETEYFLNHKKGNIRFLGYHNTANMGNYSEAMKVAGTPDVITTRKLGRTKWGFGINFDQELNKALGLFGRLGWNDGKNETWAFTEIDKTISLGLSLDGTKWKRESDNAGVAVVVSALSKDHRDYLAKGGVGFMIGDGAMNYGLESIAELYYNFKPNKLPLWLTGDYQFCANPAYNKDRGPVHIFSFRVHTEF